MYSRYSNSIDIYDIIKPFLVSYLNIIITEDEKIGLINADRVTTINHKSSKNLCQLQLYPKKKIFIKTYEEGNLIF